MKSKEEQEEIKILKEEELKEEKFWKGYSNSLKQQIKTDNIFQEVQTFKNQQEKEKNNFFKKFFKILGF
jgi:hypothetical protein